MRGPRLLSVIFVLILISSTVIAQQHHENIEDAKEELLILTIYIRDTYEIMNKTFFSILNDEPMQAVYHAENLSARILSVGENLQKIPKDITSYEVLASYYRSLINAEGNFSRLSFYNLELSNIILFSSNFTIQSWNLSRFIEPVEELDGILIRLPTLLGDLDTSIGSIRENLGQLEDGGVDLSFHLNLLDQVEDHIEGIETDWILPELVKGPILSDLMGSWAIDLAPIPSENLTESDLRTKLDLMETLELDSGISILVGHYLENFTDIEVSTINLSRSFEELEKDLMILENSNNTFILGRYSAFLTATYHIEAIEEHMLVQKEILEDHSEFDNGSVRENLTRLENELNKLKYRLDSINIFEEDMQRMSDLASEVLFQNIVNADPNSDGNISFEEAIDLIGPEPAEIPLIELLELNNRIWAEIQEIQGYIDPQIHSIFSVLTELFDAVEEFTNLHFDLIEEITFLAGSDPEATTQEHVDSFRDATSSYMDMVSNLEEISLVNNSLSGTNITFDNSSIPLLTELMDMYGSLLLNISSGRNFTGIYLSFKSDTISYDKDQIIRVIVVETDLEGNSVFPIGETVEIMFYGRNLSSVITKKGISEIEVHIDRSMILGSHTVNASYLGQNGIYLNISRQFEVVKIGTLLGIDPVKLQVEPGEMIDISITVIDEMSRFVQGQISIMGQNVSIEGPIVIPLSFLQLGEDHVEIKFLGDDWYESSSGSLELEVNYIPKMEISLEKSSFYQGEEMNYTITLINGSGLFWVEIDGERSEWTDAFSGSSFDHSLNTTNFTVGIHSIQVGLESNAYWVRDGLGPRLVFTIMEPLPEPVEPDPPFDDDDDITDDDEENQSSPEKHWYDNDLIRIGALIVLVVLIIATLTLFVINMSNKKQRPKLSLPGKRKTPSSTEETNQSVSSTDGKKKARPFTPDLNKAREVLPEDRVDPRRLEVVASYLEVVDRAPKDMKVRRSDTPREAQGKLVTRGAEKKASSDLVDGFEEALYKEEAPTEQNVEKVKSSASLILEWYGTIPEEEIQ